MAEIILKLLIIIMFLAMAEIPYIVKILGVAILGAAVIIDWHNTD